MKYLIVGAGTTGSSLARYLEKVGEEFVVVDDKKEGFPRPQEVDLRDFDQVVLSPGIPMNHWILKKTKELDIEAIGDVEFAFRRLGKDVKILGITGTNGKSTTTVLLGEMLKSSGFKVFVGGNLGRPFVEALDGDYKLAVLELSSFQLDKIKSFRAHVACLLNITFDHGDYYGNFEEYVRSKLRIFENQGEEDWSVVMCPEYGYAAKGRKVLLGKEILVKGDRVEIDVGDGLSFGKKDLFLPGRHNLINAACASSCALIMGASPEIILDTLGSFRGLPHRIEFVGEGRGVKFYNDSKGTNIDAVVKAVESFEESVVLLMGGRFKGGDLDSLMEVMEGKVRLLVVFGEAGDLFYSAFSKRFKVFKEESLAGALDRVFSMVEPGDTVLLSPGCSSFDEFESYRERGEFFKESVRAWIGKS